MIQPHLQVCLWCGQLAGEPVIHRDGRVFNLTYLCPNQHMMIIKTLRPQAG